MAVQNEAKDPAAAALLAIEEALNLVKQETPTPAGPDQVPTEPSWTRTGAAIAVGRPARVASLRRRVPTPEIRALRGLRVVRLLAR